MKKTARRERHEIFWKLWSLLQCQVLAHRMIADRDLNKDPEAVTGQDKFAAFLHT